MWVVLRKSGTGIHVSFAHTFSNNLMAYNIRACTDTPGVIEISLDLNPNLRKRDTGAWPNIDAHELIDYGVGSLTLVQLFDQHIFDHLDRILRRTEPARRSGYFRSSFRAAIVLQSLRDSRMAASG